jgi:proteasome lid subunit RPN8/RPN11
LKNPERARSGEEIVGLRELCQRVVYDHVFQNGDREVGGMLVGRVPVSGGMPLVTGAIPAIDADEQATTLTFTQDAWAHVHRRLGRDFPDQDEIVGWYHSHPGHGIFLSDHDLFIHRNFFGGASQVALVVDPHAGTEGLFVWKDKNIEPSFERPVPEPWLSVAPGRRRRAVVPALQPPAAGDYPLMPLLVAALIGVLVGFGGWQIVSGGDAGAGHDRARSPVRAKPHEPTTKLRSHPTLVEPKAGVPAPSDSSNP